MVGMYSNKFNTELLVIITRIKQNLATINITVG